MKMNKKILIFLCLMIVFSSTSIAFAKDNSKVIKESKISQKKLKQYGLKDVDKLPDGIVPIVINSEEELDAYMAKLKDSFNSKLIVEEPYTMAAISGTTIQRRISKSQPFSLATLNLYALIEIYSNGSFGQITKSLYEGMSLTGYTVGLELDQTSVRTNPTISGDGQSIYVIGEADIHSYLIIDGMIKVTTTHKVMSFTYSI